MALATRPAPGKILIIGGEGEAPSTLHALLRNEGFAVETFASACALLDTALPEAPCCIVAEAKMPQIDGLDLIERLERRGEPIPVVLVTDEAHVPLSVRAIKAGAVDFLPRPYDERDMLGAVEHALEIDSRRRKVARNQRSVIQRFEMLTQRERQVLDGVVRGLMNKQIAWELDISEVTVKLHRSSMMRKMDLRSVPDLVRASQILPAEYALSCAA